jgi:hypothetical protein
MLLAEARAIARERGGRLLSTAVSRAFDRLTWELSLAS